MLDGPAKFALGLLLIAVIAGPFAGSSKSETSTSAVKPKLSFVLLTYPRGSKHGLPICNENRGNHKTFRFKLSGFTPNGSAMIIVRYPNGKFYWYHKNYGVVHVDGGGNFFSAPWACWKGPNGTMDPPGKYLVTAIDFASNQTAPKQTFAVVNP